MSPQESRELIQLWLLANEGIANEAQLASLNERIAASVEARDLLISLAQQQGWMKWNAVDAHGSPQGLGGGPSCAELATRAIDNGRGRHGQRLSRSAAGTQRGSGAAAGRRDVKNRWRRLLSSELFVAASVVLACLFGYVAGRRADEQTAATPSPADASGGAHATMVSGTGCVWGAGEEAMLAQGGKFDSGDTLQLLEGIAEFNVGPDADVRLQMEGPTSMVLASDLGLNLSYGKVILSTMSQDGRPVPVDTAFGRILVDYGGEIGLITFGSKAEIHCFQGHATVNSPWLQREQGEVAVESLAAGESMTFEHVGSPSLQATRGVADKLRFTPQVAMSNDFLSVTPEYVHEIVAAQPVAYWRFEDTANGNVKNEMGPHHQGRIQGKVGWAGPDGNRVLELGLTEEPGSLHDNESWDDVLAGDFSIELWMKPSHHQLGSMVGFVGPYDPVLRRNQHGVLLELGGPVGRWDWMRVNRVRFLHRSPLSAYTANDVSCFSQDLYAARKWQHLVATKAGDQLRLYVDGKMVASGMDAKPTPRGLQLVIGQLYTESLDRFFIGQLDEIAIYDRALSANEISRHHEHLRPPTTPPEAIF